MAATATKVQPTNKLSFAQLETLWVQGGGSTKVAPTMAAIAEAESGGRIDAINNTAYPNLPGYHTPGPGASPEYSVGPWQVNLVAHSQYTKTAMLNPLQNAQAAVAIGGVNGERLNNWSTYSNGQYLNHLPGGSQADSGIGISAKTFWNIVHAVGNTPLFPGGPTASQSTTQSPPAQAAGAALDKYASGIGKDILYAAIILGGGLLVITGLILIGADLGISAFESVKKSKPANIVVNVRNSSAQRQYKQSRKNTGGPPKNESGEGRNRFRDKSVKNAQSDDIPF